MRAAGGIQASLGQAQPLYRAAIYQMLGDDLLDILRLYEAVVDRFRIDHQRWPVFALIQAAGLVHSHSVAQTGGSDAIFHAGVNLALAVGSAGRPRRLRCPEIGADKDVAIKSRQRETPLGNADRRAGMSGWKLLPFYLSGGPRFPLAAVA